MMPFDAYRCYLSLKNHFTKDHYDYHKYRGKTRATVQAFYKRKDRFWFEKFARSKNDKEVEEFFVSNFIYPNIKELSVDPGSKDYKTRLQEYYAKKGKKVSYEDQSAGPDHRKEFLSEVILDSKIIGKGKGKSKKSAQQHAAKQALSNVS